MGLVNRIFSDHSDEIKKYCAEHGLSVEKVFSSGWSANKTHTFLTYFEPHKYPDGYVHCIDGNSPRAVPTLKIFLEDGKLRFEQTEHTHVLYEREPVMKMAYA